MFSDGVVAGMAQPALRMKRGRVRKDIEQRPGGLLDWFRRPQGQYAAGIDVADERRARPASCREPGVRRSCSPVPARRRRWRACRPVSAPSYRRCAARTAGPVRERGGPNAVHRATRISGSRRGEISSGPAGLSPFETMCTPVAAMSSMNCDGDAGAEQQEFMNPLLVVRVREVEHPGVDASAWRRQGERTLVAVAPHE